MLCWVACVGMTMQIDWPPCWQVWPSQPPQTLFYLLPPLEDNIFSTFFLLWLWKFSFCRSNSKLNWGCVVLEVFKLTQGALGRGLSPSVQNAAHRFPQATHTQTICFRHCWRSWPLPVLDSADYKIQWFRISFAAVSTRPCWLSELLRN